MTKLFLQYLFSWHGYLLSALYLTSPWKLLCGKALPDTENESRKLFVNYLEDYIHSEGIFIIISEQSGVNALQKKICLFKEIKRILKNGT